MGRIYGAIPEQSSDTFRHSLTFDESSRILHTKGGEMPKRTIEFKGPARAIRFRADGEERIKRAASLLRLSYAAFVREASEAEARRVLDGQDPNWLPERVSE